MYEAIPVPIELGVPLPSKYNHADLRSRVEAACATAEFLREQGAQYAELTKGDKEDAARLAFQHGAGMHVTNTQITQTSTQALRYAKFVLDEYGHKAAESANQIRNLVTTKLITESENADPRIRMKAIELLGKISDVGLFAEKTEVTVTHQTSDELKDKLRQKLEKLINPPKTATHAKDTARLESQVTKDDPALDFSEVPIPGEYEEIKKGGK